MKSANGWYSVHDLEHRPVPGEEVLVLALLDDCKTEAEPFIDPGNRVYYIAVYHEQGDVLHQEVESDRLEERIFGRPEPVLRSGYYYQVPHIHHQKNTQGGALPETCVHFKWERLAFDTEGADGIICWKPLDYPWED